MNEPRWVVSEAALHKLLCPDPDCDPITYARLLRDELRRLRDMKSPAPTEEPTVEH